MLVSNHTVWGRIPNTKTEHIHYWVSIDGDLISSNYIDQGGRPRPPRILSSKTNHGEYVPTITKNIRQGDIHRAMLVTFYPLGENEEVNHLNGIRDDNRLENLEWCTTKENINHAIDNGLRHRCLVAGHNRSSQGLQDDIKELGQLVPRLSNNEIGRRLNCNKATAGKYR